MSASSWKKQSSRLKTGSMNLVNNDTIYGENATFHHLECKFAYVSDLSSTTASFTTISAETAYLDSAYVNDLYITNLGQNNIPNDRWLNVDASNGIYIIDLSSSGNYTSIGGHSLMKQKTAWGSTAIGYDAMRNISTRTDLSFANTAVGTSAMYGSDLVNGITGIKNAALGNNALSSITTGSNNSAFGYNSLSSNTTGLCNTAAGELSLNLNTTGIYNVGVGSRSLLTNTIGSYNSVCGSCALMMNTTGCNNVSCGHNSMSSNEIGCNNAAIGYNSMFKNKDASANTAIGASSLYSNINGMNNVAIGYNALYSDVSGSFNTVVGAYSDVSNTMLDRVQILGYNNKSAYSNVNIIGTDISASGPSKTFISNVADSSSSLISNVVMYDPVTKEMSYDSRMLHKVAVDASGYTSVVIGDASQNTSIAGSLCMSLRNPIYFSITKTFSAWQYDFSNTYIGFGNGVGHSNFNMDNSGNTSTNGNGNFYMNNASMNASNPIYMTNNSPIYLSSSNTANYIQRDTGTNSIAISGFNGGYLQGTNGSVSKTLVWDNSGNVGINNASPNCHLDIYDSSNGANYVMACLKSEPANGGQGVTSTTFINLEKGTGYGGCFGGSLNQQNYSCAVINALSNGVISANNIKVTDLSGIQIYCKDNGGLFIDTLNRSTSAVYSNGGFLSNTSPSDPSLKKNIVSLYSLSDIYDNLIILNPVHYEWIDSNMGQGIKYGFLANEVKELFPDIVSTWKDASGNDKLGYDPVSLIPIIINGVKKQNEEISLHRQEINELKKEIDDLKIIVSKLV